jgi:phenylacetate-CoA ligase
MSGFFAKKIYLPLAGRFKGMDVPAALARLNESQYLSAKELKERQWTRVLEVLRYSAATVPYYREKWKKSGIDPGKIQSPADFLRVPILEKGEIRDNLPAFKSESYKGRIFRGRTSGSTGIPLEILFSPRYMECTQAAQWRGRGWYGINRGDRTVAFWGRPFHSKFARFKNTVKNRLQNIFVITPFELTDRELGYAWAEIAAFKPKFIYGYGSSIARFAEFMRDTGRSIEFPVNVVFYTAEMLFDFQKMLAGEMFRTKIASEYGSTEAGAFAFECPEGSLHVSDENVYMEIVRPDGTPAAAGETGEVVATTLTNECMPLIRYRLGDMAALLDGACPCGRMLTLMELRGGKITSLVRTPSGGVFSSEVFDYIGLSLADEEVRTVRAFRIIQKTLSRIVVQIELSAPDERAVELFRKYMNEKLGSDIEVDFEYVEKIGPDKTGKIRYFISEIGDGPEK